MKKANKQDIAAARIFTKDIGIDIPDNITETELDELIEQANIEQQRKDGAVMTSFIASEQETIETYQDINSEKVIASKELTKQAAKYAKI
jgi:hypothetical protein